MLALGLWEAYCRRSIVYWFSKKDEYINCFDIKKLGSDQIEFNFVKFQKAGCSGEFSAKLKMDEIAKKGN